MAGFSSMARLSVFGQDVWCCAVSGDELRSLSSGLIYDERLPHLSGSMNMEMKKFFIFLTPSVFSSLRCYFSVHFLLFLSLLSLSPSHTCTLHSVLFSLARARSLFLFHHIYLSLPVSHPSLLRRRATPKPRPKNPPCMSSSATLQTWLPSSRATTPSQDASLRTPRTAPTCLRCWASRRGPTISGSSRDLVCQVQYHPGILFVSCHSIRMSRQLDIIHRAIHL